MDEIGVDERTVTRAITVMLEYKMIEKGEFGKIKVIFEETEC